MSARRGMLYAPWPTDTSVSALPYKPLINYKDGIATAATPIAIPTIAIPTIAATTTISAMGTTSSEASPQTDESCYDASQI